MTDTAQDAHVSDADDAQDATSPDNTQAPAQDATPTGFDALPKETQDEIRALRRENARYRKAAKEAEDAEKTELQRLTGERDDYKGRYEALEAKYRESRAESAFIEAAGKANARSPKTLFRAFKSDIEYDDDGNATNVADLIATLQQDEPDLFRHPEGDGGKGKTPTSNDMNALIRKAAGRT